jgi:hypothetical protein
MMAFDLCCENEHIFEVWFQDTEAFEVQREKNLLACPECGSKDIRKALSPVAVLRNKRTMEDNATKSALRQVITKAYEFIEKNTEDVGSEFAKEALKIHYQIEEPRNIRGVATAQDEKMLRDEGINFFKLPVPSEKKTDLN